MTKNRGLSLLFLLLFTQANQLRAEQKPEERPNILVILSDDQGYNDAGFQGSKEVPTPNLDRLAGAGMRCKNAYVTHPYCSPSRAALLTGRYQARFGHERNPNYDPDNHQEGLPLTESLFPEFMAKAGYVTGWIGKWHLGAAPEFHPEKRGFAETFGFIGGGHQYLNWHVKPGPYTTPILRNGTPVEVKEHLTLAFGHEAADFIQRHQRQPWFLYLAFNAPHMPHQPTSERLQRFANIKNPQRRAYLAQISLLDDAIGETLDALKNTGQEKRTLVFFLSDNGGPHGPPNNYPLRGCKGQVYDGGIHVPFLVSWPGHLPAGKDFEPVVSSLDIAATAMAMAKVPAPTVRPFDGVDLLPYLSGEKSGNPNEKLFWRETAFSEPQAAVREDAAKLVCHYGKADELYDLKSDIGEKRNRAASDAVTTGRLHKDLMDWMHQMSKYLAFPGLRHKDDPAHPQAWPGISEEP